MFFHYFPAQTHAVSTRDFLRLTVPKEKVIVMLVEFVQVIREVAAFANSPKGKLALAAYLTHNGRDFVIAGKIDLVITVAEEHLVVGAQRLNLLYDIFSRSFVYDILNNVFLLQQQRKLNIQIGQFQDVRQRFPSLIIGLQHIDLTFQEFAEFFRIFLLVYYLYRNRLSNPHTDGLVALMHHFRWQ